MNSLPDSYYEWKPVENWFERSFYDEDNGITTKFMWDHVNELLYVTEIRPDDVPDAIGNIGRTVFLDFSGDEQGPKLRLCKPENSFEEITWNFAFMPELIKLDAAVDYPN